MDALPQICSKYKYLFFSVHLLCVEDFKTSIDKLVGRMTNGRVLTKPAFNLWPVEGKPYVARLIAEVLLGLLFTNYLNLLTLIR